MSLSKKMLAPAVLVAAAVAPQAQAATFDFYENGGPLVSSNSSALSFSSGGLTLTVTAASSGGSSAQVANRWDGLGVYTGGLDASDVGSSAFNNPGDVLILTFSQAIQLSSLSFSAWDGSLLGDAAKLTWANGLYQNLTTATTGGTTPTFTWSGSTSPSGTVLKIQATGSFSSFRLAGLTVSAVPESPAMAMMALGLAGLGVAVRRRRED